MKHTNPPKRLQDLNLMDRFLFCEVIENAEAYKIILEIALSTALLTGDLPSAHTSPGQVSQYAQENALLRRTDDKQAAACRNYRL